MSQKRNNLLTRVEARFRGDKMSDRVKGYVIAFEMSACLWALLIGFIVRASL
jgi:hypothetical protein